MSTSTPARGVALDRAVPGVVTIAWPAPPDVRDAVAAAGRACLLVVPAGQPPPGHVLPLEDWIREPIDPTELELRTNELARRRRVRTQDLHVDDDGLLHLGDRWVALSPVQRSLMAPLITHVGRPVPLDEVRRSYVAAGGPDDGRPLRRALARLRDRLAEIGVELHVLSGRAVLIEAPSVGLFT
jgi:hypothetical protein